ncbi:MAG: metallophosphoesterase [Bauldia sp.]|nr:metallophosphoesterase [Bauldia sp.]
MYTLAHLSDPHLGPIPRPQLRELMSKRLIGYFNWQSNRKGVHRPEVVRELIENIHAASPDHIVVTGDLVNLALPEEILLARHWLDQLGDPQHVTVIPGNHDAYVPGALAQTRRHWGDFMIGDDANGMIVFPFIRRRGPLGIVGVNSARATAPFMATGHLSARQIEMMELALRRLHREEMFRVVLLHHPPAPVREIRTARLVEAEEFLAAIARSGAELILHGHLHTGSLVYVDGAHGRVPVVGVPSASNPPGRMSPAAAFNLYRVGGKQGAFTCHMTSVGFTAPDAPASLIADRQLLG